MTRFIEKEVVRGDIFNYGERWEDIDGFPRYQVSSEGRIFNKATGHYQSWSPNNYGHPKISLLDERGERRTRSVAFIVAKHFVQKPNELCDRVIWLNGDLEDVRAENLAWRPRWFAWNYTHQFKVEQPAYYKNLPVVNLETNVEYENIIEAGMVEGLLFDHIWRATYAGTPTFPTGSTWQIEKRV